MFGSPPIRSMTNSATTSISLTHATFDPSLINSSQKIPGERPKLVRKKSGEVVRSALKSFSQGSVSSPTSPTHNKTVKFPTSLARVRSFDKLQCPQSVSGFIPMSFNFLNFASNDHIIETAPVCLEKVELDLKESKLVGSVRVSNFAFQKHVIIRYSFDHWSTFDHTNASYLRSIYLCHQSQDQFQFNIPIPTDMRVSSDPNTTYNLKFAVQYCVNGQEFWDNNQGRNYSLQISPTIEVDPTSYDMSFSEPILTLQKVSSEVESSQGSPDLSEFIDFTIKTISKPRTNLGSRYSFNHSLAKSTTISHNRSNSSPWAIPSQSAITITESFYPTASIPIPIPSSQNMFGTSPSAVASLSCSPSNYGYGWIKARTSWFDTIPIKDFGRSPPVQSS